ncbi:helix-turn-helix domain-containing protein [Aerolutibacter daejeonensis]|uniref:helix-turn-helix domain-containing protein n=1 Tax=Aerolutibacter daejeonensis TaxID=346181 RepID=UPI0009FDDAD7|nr:helix-turn-helix domain-containing protein [Lysobacter daejeonensis]
MTKPDTESDNAPRRNLSEQEAADYLGVLSVRTLQDWRRKRTGPAYLRLGRRVAYPVRDLDAFLMSARVAPKGAS